MRSTLRVSQEVLNHKRNNLFHNEEIKIFSNQYYPNRKTLLYHKSGIY